MSPEQLQRFKRLLESEQQSLLATRQAAKDSTRPVVLDQSSVGRLSRMDAMQGQAMAVESQRRRDVQLQRIQSALERIQNGEYGYCLVCEEEIYLPRLETDPAVPLCLDCASRREQSST
ncbi:MAG: molecular chaperone DnaK [Desulfuromonas sp.]|nr:MAG: molecular chaperone DnaK [Desulfuromonas sp.]